MQNFVETINNLGTWLVDNFRQLSIELLILAGIVGVILFLLRVRSPRVRYAFWLLVLAKPVVTLLIASPVSLYWFLQPAVPVSPPPMRTVVVAPPSAAPMMPRGDFPRTYRRGMDVTMAATVEVKEPSIWSQINVYGITAVAWLVIATVLGLRLLVGFAYVVFLRQTAQVQGRDTPLGKALLEAAERLRMRPRCRVALSGVSHAPVLAGITRPLILLPRALTRELPPEQVRLVIAHELTHVRRWDNLVLLLQRIAEMLLFFHPVIWLCGWVMRREAENACDDAVLRAYGLSAEYAESLTRVAQTHHNLARRLLVNTFAAAESNLARRVRRILTSRPGRTTLVLSISAVVALVLLGCLGLPTTAEKKSEPIKTEVKKGNTMTKSDEQSDLSAKLAGTKTPERIDMPAPSEASGNTYARGMSAVLSYLGTDISYERVMGLTGVAFILQVDTGGPLIDGNLDCAWWPNDAWGFDLGLPVLSKATGWDFRKIQCNDADAYKADPAAEYRRVLAPTIETSLAAGKPVLAKLGSCFIVTAADNEEPPLLGYGARDKSTQFKDMFRSPDYPCGLFVFGEKTTPLDSKKVDLLSLQHIVALFHEQAQGADAPKTRFSGRQAWKEWLALQRKNVGCDNNMLIHLRYNRGSAVAYLRDMAGRHAGKMKEHINAAVDLYQQELDELNKQDLPYGRVQNGESEQVVAAEYIAMMERVFKLETQAIEHLRQALLAAGIDSPPMAEGGLVSKPSDGSSAALNGEKIMSNTTNQTSNKSVARNVHREGRKVWIEGIEPLIVKEDRRSSFFVAMKAALCAMGEETTYDELLGISAYAFRVQFYGKKFWCDSAPCPVCGADSAGAALAAFGYGETTYMAEENAPEEVSKARKAVMASIDAGRPVLGLVSLEQGKIDWGLIVGYQDDGKQFLCRGSDNATNAYLTSLIWPWLTIVLERKGNPPARKESTIASLKQALVQASTPKFGDYFSGSAAYACWTSALGKDDAIRSMPPKDLRAACEGNKLHALLLLDSRLAAVRYLRSIAGYFGGDTSKHLLTAAKYYDDAAKVLADSQRQTPPLWASNVEWTPERRNAQIKVLQAAADFDSLANVEIEQALKAEGTPFVGLEKQSSGTEESIIAAGKTNSESLARNVRREGGKVWIEGVKGFDPCQYVSSVHGSDARILQMLGESLTYDDLICYSAFAFRVGFHNKNCPSAGHPCCGYTCMENGVRATPWKNKYFDAFPGKLTPEEQATLEVEARAAIKASIDRGIPVHYASEENGLIIGYADEGRRWWCIHPYYKNGREAFWYDEGDGFAGGKDKWPWGIVIYTEPKSEEEKTSKRELTMTALKQAVDMWKTEKRGDYFVGDAAYGFWLQWLRDVEAGKAEDPKAGMQGSAWCFEVLIQSRRIAGTWLDKAADDFSGETARQLHIAADHYSRIAEECMKGIKSSWDLAPAPKQFDTWTSQMRQEQITRLEAARECDRAAIEAITMALTAEERNDKKNAAE